MSHCRSKVGRDFDLHLSLSSNVRADIWLMNLAMLESGCVDWVLLRLVVVTAVTCRITSL